MADILEREASPLAGEASPFELVNRNGGSDVLLVCEHAGRLIPPALEMLGLAVEHRAEHIVWDIGARALSLKLSRMLDATLAMQRYSRLIYDCNRDWGARDETPAMVDTIEVPGNRNLSEAQRRCRRDAFYGPFRDGIRRVIDDRLRQGQRTAIVTIHSFTPVFKGKMRTLDIGIVYDSDTRLADIMCETTAPKAGGLDIRRNEPYGPDRGVTQTLKVHGLGRGLMNVMVEIRNDHIDNDAGQARFANLMADWIRRSVDIAFQIHD